MTATTFDALGYFEKMKSAGMPETQAKVQLEALQDVIKNYDEAARKDLATKGDLKDLKHDMLRWMVGGFITQTALLVAILSFLR